MNHKRNKSQGFSLMELIVAVALFMIFAGGLAGTAISGYLTGFENARIVRANAIMTESWEALKSIRNDGWVNITNGSHGLSSQPGYWVFSGTSDVYDGFTRSVVVENAFRDDLGNIVLEGAPADPDTKKITVQLAWESATGQPRLLSVGAYLTNYINPAVWPTPPPPGP